MRDSKKEESRIGFSSERRMAKFESFSKQKESKVGKRICFSLRVEGERRS
jgi:hypothetical protein